MFCFVLKWDLSALWSATVTAWFSKIILLSLVEPVMLNILVWNLIEDFIDPSFLSPLPKLRTFMVKTELMCRLSTRTCFLVFYRPSLLLFASALISKVPCTVYVQLQLFWQEEITGGIFLSIFLALVSVKTPPCSSALTLSSLFSCRQSTIAVRWSIPGDQQRCTKINVKDSSKLESLAVVGWGSNQSSGAEGKKTERHSEREMMS